MSKLRANLSLVVASLLNCGCIRRERNRRQKDECSEELKMHVCARNEDLGEVPVKRRLGVELCVVQRKKNWPAEYHTYVPRYL
jgi:hypothetical protein